MALTRAQLVPSTWLSLFAENPPLSSLPPHCHTVTHTQGHVSFVPYASCSVLASPVVRLHRFRLAGPPEWPLARRRPRSTGSRAGLQARASCAGRARASFVSTRTSAPSRAGRGPAPTSPVAPALRCCLRYRRALHPDPHCPTARLSSCRPRPVGRAGGRCGL